MYNISVTDIDKVEKELIITVDITKDGDPLIIPTSFPELPTINLTGHKINVPIEAIGSRMVLYKTTSPKRALQAILREHVGRMAPDLLSPQTREEVVSWIKNESEDIITVTSDLADGELATARALILEAAERRRK